MKREPFAGRKVLVTRSRTQASELSTRINKLGGQAIELPVIDIRKTDDLIHVNHRFNQLDTFDWVVFTSVNGVRCFFELLADCSVDIRLLQRAKFAAVGPRTAALLQAKGCHVELIPDTYEASHLASQLVAASRVSQKFLLVKGNLARAVLPERLRETGRQVIELIVYYTEPTPEPDDEVVAMLQYGYVDTVTFTSSSTVINLCRKLEQSGVVATELINQAVVACIGSITAETARALGLRVDIIPPEATIPSLITAMMSD